MILYEVYNIIAAKRSSSGNPCINLLNRNNFQLLTKNNRELVIRFAESLVIWNGDGKNNKAIKSFVKLQSYDNIGEILLGAMKMIMSLSLADEIGKESKIPLKNMEDVVASKGLLNSLTTLAKFKEDELDLEPLQAFGYIMDRITEKKLKTELYLNEA